MVAVVLLVAVGTAPGWTARLLPKKASIGIDASAGTDWYETAFESGTIVPGGSVFAAVADLGKDARSYRGQLVVVPGIVDSLATAGGRTVLRLVDGPDDVIVTYLGRRPDLAAGQSATVAGLISPEGDQLLALSIGKGRSDAAIGPKRRPMSTLLASAAFLVGAIAIRVRRRWSGDGAGRASKAVALGLSLLVVPFLVGCEVRIDTVVRENGSGSVDTQAVTGIDKMTEIMQLPNAQAFTESWLEQAQAGGSKVDRTNNKLRLQRSFDSLEEFNAGAGGGGTWSYLGRVRQPDGEHMYFIGRIDTTRLYPQKPSGEDDDTEAYDQLDTQLDDTNVTYSLSLPGVPLSGPDRQRSWAVPMNGRELLFAESLVRSKELPGLDPTVLACWTAADRWIAGCAAAMFAYAMLAYPWRRRTTSV